MLCPLVCFICWGQALGIAAAWHVDRAGGAAVSLYAARMETNKWEKLPFSVQGAAKQAELVHQ